MAADLHDKLIDHLEDAHAMEKNVLRMLKSMISTTEDEVMRHDLEHHYEETQRHESLLRERLEAHGSSPSTVKDIGGMASAFFKAPLDMARRDKIAKNARDGYMTEHLEIASYELLERVARRAGDEATVEVARRNRADEQAMAQKIANNWDRVVELALSEQGVTV
jgi:ferritin-like metal-binding protein YciE